MATTQEEKSSTKIPKMDSFLLNHDSKSLVTYISLFKPQFSCVFHENNDVC